MARGKIAQLPSGQTLDDVNQIFLYLGGLDADVHALEGSVLSSNSSRASTTVLASEIVLQQTLQANKKYRISGRLFVNGNFKYRLAGPAGAGLVLVERSLLDTAGSSRTLDQAYNAADVVLANIGILSLSGVIHNGSNAGQLQLNWAQNASNVTPTILYAGSFIAASLIG